MKTDSGTGFAGLLTIVFIALKLTGFIQWSWLWVLSPIWISACVVALIIMAVGLLGIAQEISRKKSKSK